MSVRLSDYGIDENEWIPAEGRPELEWLANPYQDMVGAQGHPELEWPKNPYQAVADAQVRAGAWPGTPLLLEAATAYSGPAPQQEEPEEDQDVLGACPWDFLFEFSPPEKRKSGCGSSTLESTDDNVESCEPHDSSDTFIEGYGSMVPTEGESSSSRSGWKLSHRCVPRATDFAARFGMPPQQYRRSQPQPLGTVASSSSSSISRCPIGMGEPGDVTTLMIRHIPNVYTRSMLVEELAAHGLDGLYDFLYLPIDKSTQWNVGYAFVNFISPASATKCVTCMTDYVFKCFEHNSGKVTQVSIAHIQGLQRNLEYYSNTAVQCVGSQTNRPLVLAAGHQGKTTSRGSGTRRRRRQRPGRVRQAHQEDSAEAEWAADAGSVGAAGATELEEVPWPI